jgi:hypothetical protein
VHLFLTWHGAPHVADDGSGTQILQVAAHILKNEQLPTVDKG